MKERNELGQFVPGHKNIGGFQKGAVHSKETRAKISESLRGKFGENSRNWKGEDAGYVSKHEWVTRHFQKPDHCEVCKTMKVKIEWANISKKYKRQREDWIALCVFCHKQYDRKMYCPRGHLYTLESVYVTPKGWRQCKICRRIRKRKWRNENLNL